MKLKELISALARSIIAYHDRYASREEVSQYKANLLQSSDSRMRQQIVDELITDICENLGKGHRKEYLELIAKNYLRLHALYDQILSRDSISTIDDLDCLTSDLLSFYLTMHQLVYPNSVTDSTSQMPALTTWGFVSNFSALAECINRCLFEPMSYHIEDVTNHVQVDNYLSSEMVVESDLLKELLYLRDMNQGLTTDLITLRTDTSSTILTLEQEIENLNGKLMKNNALLKENDEVIRALREEIDTHIDKYVRLDEQSRQNISALEDKQDLIAKHESNIQELRGERDTLTDDFDALQERQARLEGKSERLATDLEGKQKIIEKQELKIQELLGNNSTLAQENEDLTRQVSLLTRRVDRLGQASTSIGTNRYSSYRTSDRTSRNRDDSSYGSRSYKY